MIGRRVIPRLNSPAQVMAWADQLVRILQAGDVDLDGAQVTYVQFTANQDNFALQPGFLHRFNTDAPRTVTGLAGGTAGRAIVVANVGVNNLILANKSGSSQAANQIVTGTGGNLTIAGDVSWMLVYDDKSALWRVVQ